MTQQSEDPAKVWQIDSVKEHQVAQDRLIDRLDSKVSDYAKDQVTTLQLEERIRSLNGSYEDKLLARTQRHDADIREINLRYGPIADNYKWITRLMIALVLSQIVAFGFNVLGSR